MTRPVVIRLVSYVRIPRDTHRRKITRRAVFARDDWTCQYCGARSNLTVDHVIPRSKGGSSSWDNIVASCAPCNRRKGDRLPRQVGMRLCRATADAEPARCSSTWPARRSRPPGSSTWRPDRAGERPRSPRTASSCCSPATGRRPRTPAGRSSAGADPPLSQPGSRAGGAAGEARSGRRRRGGLDVTAAARAPDGGGRGCGGGRRAGGARRSDRVRSRQLGGAVARASGRGLAAAVRRLRGRRSGVCVPRR